MVGFNRRFAPQVVRMKSLLAAVGEPKTFIYTVNAGMIPASHWSQDPAVGGGRILGEGCHFVDLLRFLVGQPISQVQAMKMGGDGPVTEDKMTFTLSFKDGSIGTVHYFANGHKSFPKERLEVFCAGRVLQLDNFRKLNGYGWPGFSKMNLWTQDKGHDAEMAALVEGVRKGVAPIEFADLVEVTRACFAIVEQRSLPLRASAGPLTKAHPIPAVLSEDA
jgi:predicted dehydrogenase